MKHWLLAVLLSLSAVPARSQALTEAGTAGLLDQILGAARLPAPGYDASRVPGQVRVLTGAEIEKSGARTLQDLLKRLPGVVTYNETGNQSLDIVDLRGFNATPVPNTVVLVDGARVNEPDFGTVHWENLPLPLIERVEVFPGAQTMFGRGAMAGVINIVTKKGRRERGAEAGVELGSFDRQRYDASVTGPAGDFGYRLSGSRETSHGYRSHESARLHAFEGRLDYKDDVSEAVLAYRFADDRVDQAGALKSSEISRDPRQNVGLVETDSNLHVLSLNYRRTLGGGFAASSNLFVRQRVENTPLNKGRTSISNSRASKFSEGATAQLEHGGELFDRKSLLTAGVEASYDKSESDSNALFFAFPPASYSGAIIRGRNLGLFIQETFDLLPKTLVLTAGARWDRSTLDRRDKDTPTESGWRGYHHASPRLALNFNPTDRLQTYVSLADSFRSPTGDEISALGPFQSTPFLMPVKSRTAEAGARLLGGRWGTASVAAFRTITHDEIFAVFDPTQGFGQNTNVPLTKREGVEASLAPRWNEVFDAAVNYTWTEATFGTDFSMDKSPSGTQHVKDGSRIPMVPRHRLYAAANGHPAPGWTLTVDELCVGSQYLFGDEGNMQRRLGSYCLAGLGVSRERGPLSLYARADNVFDRAYVVRGILATSNNAAERFLMPAPGITVSGGARWRFGALNARK